VVVLWGGGGGGGGCEAECINLHGAVVLELIKFLELIKVLPMKLDIPRRACCRKSDQNI